LFFDASLIFTCRDESIIQRPDIFCLIEGDANPEYFFHVIVAYLNQTIKFYRFKKQGDQKLQALHIALRYKY